MKWNAYGPNALLVHFAEQVGPESFATGRVIMAELQERPPYGLTDYNIAFLSLLLEFDPALNLPLDELAAELLPRLASASRRKLPVPPIKLIPVFYDGPDLESLAAFHRLKPADVVALHSAPTYLVHSLGFAPGFPYLGGLDPRLHTPRVANPRPRVAAGSVGIGGSHTGVYSVDTPGGWNLIGHTPVKMFHPALCLKPGMEEDMFYLKPGDRVQFVPEHGDAS
jgi:KipI family sensor histidine kinase inhibitor